MGDYYDDEQSDYYDNMPKGQITLDQLASGEVHERIYLECGRCGNTSLWPDFIGIESVPDYETAKAAKENGDFVLCDYCEHMCR